MDKQRLARELVRLARGIVSEANTVTLDVPLLIRVMEYAKEDAETDMDLHVAAERMIELSDSGITLTMDDYDAIVGGGSGD